MDVGTGAGLPGIPLAICLPNHDFVLVDSNSKKTRFLTQVKVALDLTNLKVVHDRVSKPSRRGGLIKCFAERLSRLTHWCRQ